MLCQRLKGAVIGQHFAGLCIYINCTNAAHAARAGQSYVQWHAPDDALSADDEFRFVGDDTGANFR